MKRIAAIVIGALLGLVAHASRDLDRMPPYDARLLVSFNRGDATDMSWAKRSPTVGAGVTLGSRVADFGGTSTAVISYVDDDALDSFPLTVVGWIYIDTYTGFRAVVSKIAQTGTYIGWHFYYGPGVSRGLAFGYSTTASNFRQTWTSTGTLAAGAWYHVAATVSSLGSTPALYINGVAQSVSTSAAGTVTSIATSEPVRICGKGGPDFTSYHDGKVDNVGIFNRAWTAAEIAAAYASGRP